MNRLEEHQRVVLTLPGAAGGPRSTLQAHVLAVSGRTAALELVDKSAIVRLSEVTHNVFLAFRYRNALIGLRGRLTTARPIGDLRFTVTDTSHIYKARGTRVDVTLPVEMRPVDASAGAAATTVNIGPDGLLARCPLTVEIGSTIAIALSVPDQAEPVEGTARVVRAADGLIAVQLDERSAEARRAFGELVIAESRSALRAKSAAPQPEDEF